MSAGGGGQGYGGCACASGCALLGKGAAVPEGCPTRRFGSILDAAREEYRRDGAPARELWLAFAKLVGSGGASRSRLEHVIEFSRAAGFRRIGVAACARYVPQLQFLLKTFREHGFEAMGLACKLGGNRFGDIGIDKDSDWILCNPLGQAYILNAFESELNVTLGLCMGHDLVFGRYSKAYVTNLTVKEKVSGDNPLATLEQARAGQRQICPYFPEEHGA